MATDYEKLNAELAQMADEWTTKEDKRITKDTVAYQNSLLHKGKKLSQEQVDNLRKVHIGRVKTESERKKLSAARKNFVYTDEIRSKISQAGLGRKPKPKSPEAAAKLREKLSAALKGKPKPPRSAASIEAQRSKLIGRKRGQMPQETREKIRNALLGKPGRKPPLEERARLSNIQQEMALERLRARKLEYETKGIPWKPTGISLNKSCPRCGLTVSESYMPASTFYKHTVACTGIKPKI